MARRRRREYLELLDAAKAAGELAIDTFNRVRNPYRNEATLILVTNAWELLAKAVLVHSHESISRGHRGETIGPEYAVERVRQRGFIEANQAETIQQIISLRHAAVHHILPPVPDEVMHHLLFFSCKFFRELIEQEFKAHAKDLQDNYLSLSFGNLTTYADKVAKAVSRVRKSSGDKRLVWLLERGIRFDGSSYITEKQFEQKYRNKDKVMPHLEVGRFVRGTDMVRLVPVQAPRNYTADVTLRKGSARDASLPVIVKRTEMEDDYPYLTGELAAKLGKSMSWAAKATTVLGLKGDNRYHQAVRTSRSGFAQRYSEAAVDRIRQQLQTNPNFNPYKSG